MRSDSSTRCLAKTGDDIDNTIGETCLLDKSGSVETRERSLLSSLQNDCVTSGEGGTDLP